MRAPGVGLFVVLWLAACGGQGPEGEQLPGPAAPDPGANVQSPGVDPTQVGPPAPPPPPPEATRRFQPGHHLALRASHAVSTLTTFRLRLPLQRGGARLRLHLRSGDGTLEVPRVFVSTGSAPTRVPVTFAGRADLSLPARSRAVSDAVPLPLQAGEDLVVTFEARGALAASGIEHLPGGEQREGAYADAAGALGGTPWRRAVGVATVDVEAEATPVVVALGDSITEGYISGTDDLRDAWPHVAALELGLPVLNAGVSGQGTVALLENLDAEVLVLEGVTDCVVFIGTNDLHSHTGPQLIERLNTLYDRLRPFCRVWGATLLPKERQVPSLQHQLQVRAEVNAWLRSAPAGLQGVLDFDVVLRDPAAPDHFLPGMDEDDIHPSRAGQARLGEEAARFFRTPQRLVP